MQQQSLEKVLPYSLPIKVRFAGFQSNTLALAEAGWDLSLRQTFSPWKAGVELELAMKHAGAGLYGITNVVHVEMARIYDLLHGNTGYAALFTDVGFEVRCIAPDIRCKIFPIQTTGSVREFANAFSPVDPRPQDRESSEVSVRDFKFFKVANPTLQDIIVSPDQVPQLLEMVLKAQEPTMQGIRARERSRESEKWVNEEFRSVLPAHHVQAQLITLAG
jgi:hypothetical protein